MKTHKIFGVLVALSLFLFTSTTVLAIDAQTVSQNAEPQPTLYNEGKAPIIEPAEIGAIPTLFNIDEVPLTEPTEIKEETITPAYSADNVPNIRPVNVAIPAPTLFDDEAGRTEELTKKEILKIREKRMMEVNERIKYADSEEVGDEVVTEFESLRMERRELLNEVREMKGEIRLTNEELNEEEKESFGKFRSEANEKKKILQSRFKESVQEMIAVRREGRGEKLREVKEKVLQIANNNPEVGEKMKEIMVKYEKNQQEAEASLEEISKRGRFMKFLIGPKYSSLKKIEQKMEDNEANVDELRKMKSNMRIEEDKMDIDNQIAEIKTITEEIKEDAKQQRKGISLFGWLNRMLNR